MHVSNNIPFQSEFCRQFETVTGDVGGGGGGGGYVADTLLVTIRWLSYCCWPPAAVYRDPSVGDEIDTFIDVKFVIILTL